MPARYRIPFPALTLVFIALGAPPGRAEVGAIKAPDPPVILGSQLTCSARNDANPPGVSGWRWEVEASADGVTWPVTVGGQDTPAMTFSALVAGTYTVRCTVSYPVQTKRQPRARTRSTGRARCRRRERSNRDSRREAVARLFILKMMES